MVLGGYLPAQETDFSRLLQKGEAGMILSLTGPKVAPNKYSDKILLLRIQANYLLDGMVTARELDEELRRRCAETESAVCREGDWIRKQIAAEEGKPAAARETDGLPPHRRAYLAARDAAALLAAGEQAAEAKPADWALAARAWKRQIEMLPPPERAVAAERAKGKLGTHLPPFHPDRIRLLREGVRAREVTEETHCTLDAYRPVVLAAEHHGRTMLLARTLRFRAATAAKATDSLRLAVSDLTRSIALRNELEPGSAAVVAVDRALRGHVYQELREFDKSREDFEAALPALRVLPQRVQEYSAALHNFGLLLEDTDKTQTFTDAEAKYAEAHAVYSRDFGVRLLTGMAQVRWAQRNYPDALRKIQSVEEARHLLPPERGGTERERMIATRSSRNVADIALSLCIGPLRDSEAAKEAALANILARKNLAGGSVAAELAALRDTAGPAAASLLQRIAANRAALAKLTLEEAMEETPSNGVAREKLRREEATLGVELAREFPGAARRLQAITVAELRKAIPEDSALVEYFYLREFDGTRQPMSAKWVGDLVIAVVVGRTGTIEILRLGEVDKIEPQIRAFRAALESPSTRFETAATALSRSVWHPVAKALQGRKPILAPDGNLNLIPFGALLEKDGITFAGDAHLISNAGAGRELLDWDRPLPAPAGQAVVFADIAYGPAGSWKGSPAMRAEGKKVAQHAAGLLIDGPKATKELFLQQRNPQILHVASHAFFNPQPSQRAAGVRQCSLSWVNPAAGIVFAGANMPKLIAAAIATPDEVSTMTLADTELVTLSACETGVGSAEEGEGLFGLRRALYQAGARASLVSLWRADQWATTEFMNAFYQAALTPGSERPTKTVALRMAQMAVRKNAQWRHPYYWANFVVVGSPKPLRER